MEGKRHLLVALLRHWDLELEDLEEPLLLLLLLPQA
ncbi:hypothetical protein APTSU1_000128000 [Apodemus speciosus]|uniref:Uncharacterized protein n=1 Tax=Apodemus speciosus TaxID=105296 RepID=A0ABQ0EGQ0_APOSI